MNTRSIQKPVRFNLYLLPVKQYLKQLKVLKGRLVYSYLELFSLLGFPSQKCL